MDRNKMKEIAEETGYMPGGIDELNEEELVPFKVYETHVELCFDLENCFGKCATMMSLMALWNSATDKERKRCYDIAKKHRPHDGRAIMAQKETADCIADQILAILDPELP